MLPVASVETMAIDGELMAYIQSWRTWKVGIQPAREMIRYTVFWGGLGGGNYELKQGAVCTKFGALQYVQIVRFVSREHRLADML